MTVKRRTAAENICQIMWPSVYVNGLDQVSVLVHIYKLKN